MKYALFCCDIIFHAPLCSIGTHDASNGTRHCFFAHSKVFSQFTSELYIEELLNRESFISSKTT